MVLRYRRGDATITLSESSIFAVAPATPAGFSELILLTAIVHEKWKVDIYRCRIQSPGTRHDQPENRCGNRGYVMRRGRIEGGREGASTPSRPNPHPLIQADRRG